jgi:hypothetical protein
MRRRSEAYGRSELDEVAHFALANAHCDGSHVASVILSPRPETVAACRGEAAEGWQSMDTGGYVPTAKDQVKGYLVRKTLVGELPWTVPAQLAVGPVVSR